MARVGLYLRGWRPGDEARFVMRPDMAAEMAAGGHDWSGGAPGPTWTLYRAPGTVLGIGGAIYDASGCWLMWSALSQMSRRDLVEAMGLAKWAMGRLAHRGPGLFCATVRCDLKGGVGTLQHMGFEFVARSAGPMGQEYAVMWRKG